MTVGLTSFAWHGLAWTKAARRRVATVRPERPYGTEPVGRPVFMMETVTCIVDPYRLGYMPSLGTRATTHSGMPCHVAVSHPTAVSPATAS